MDDDDPERLGIIDVAKVPLLSVEDDRPLIASIGMYSAEDFHQRRHAGAILAHQSVDLARLDYEIDVAQRLHACKAFADAAHFKHCCHRITSRTAKPSLRSRVWQARFIAPARQIAHSNCERL